jgi:hypothetical protein
VPDRDVTSNGSTDAKARFLAAVETVGESEDGPKRLCAACVLALPVERARIAISERHRPTAGRILRSPATPPGSVLMDSFAAWGIWLNSADPKQFIITSDDDFKAALNRPQEFGVIYLVLSNGEP